MAKSSTPSSRDKKIPSSPSAKPIQTKPIPEKDHQSSNLASPIASRLQFGLLILSLLSPAVFSTSVFFGFTSVRVLYFAIIVTLMALTAIWQKTIWHQNVSLLQYTVFTFLGIMAIANVHGIDPQASFWSGFSRMEGFVTYLYLGLYFILLSRLNFSNQQWTVAFVVSVVIALLVLVLSFGSKFGWQASDHRLIGTVGNPAFMAVYLLQQVIVSALLISRIEKSSNGLRNWPAIGGLLVIGIILTAGIFLTGSRSALISLGVGVFLVGVLLGIRYVGTHPKQVTLFAGIAIGLASIGWVILQTDTLQQQPVIYRLTHLSGSLDTWRPRQLSTQIALSATAEKPLLGWGQDTYNYGFARHYVPGLALEGTDWYDRVHSVPLEWAFSGGILGLLLYVAIWVVGSWQLIRSGLPVLQKCVLTAGLASYFLFNLFNPDSMLALQGFFLLLAFIDTSFQNTAKENSRLVNTQFSVSTPVWLLPARLAITVSLLLFAYFAISIPVKTLRQLNQFNQKPTLFERATLLEQTYRTATVGKTDVADQLVTLALSSLNDTNLSAADKQGCYDRAVGIWSEVCQQHPQSSRYKARLASLYIARDDYAKAFPLYQEAISIEKGKRPATFIQLGSAYMQQGAISMARSAFQQAHQLEPKWETPIVYEAIAYVVDHKPVQADSVMYTLSDAGLIANITLVKQAYYMMKNPGGLVKRVVHVPYRHQLSPDVYVEWATAAFDAHDKEGLLTALNSFARHYGARYDYNRIKQIYTDATERNVAPTDELRQLVALL